MDDKYQGRGVSAQKTEVHAAIEGLSKGLFPSAFCKILPDIVAQDENYVNIIHGDTAGTKSSLAYLYWKETGDLSVWEGIAQDAIVMNLDDMACVGCTSDIIISSTIGRNAHLITGDVIKTIIQGAEKFYDMLASHDVTVSSGGGETADVGDIVRTIDVGYTTFARMKKEELVVCDIKPGQKIIGFASYGQSTYESKYNSGIGSNGLTSARHDVLSKKYTQEYPESHSPETNESLIYAGSKTLSDTVDIDGDTYTVGQLLTSPTRTFLPLLRAILKEHKQGVKAIIHCTGGGQTKVLKFTDTPVHIVKDNLLPTPPLFKMIQEESGSSPEEMYQVFNMGHRLELYVEDDDKLIESIKSIGDSFNIDNQVIGYVESGTEKSTVTIKHDGHLIKY